MYQILKLAMGIVGLWGIILLLRAFQHGLDTKGTKYFVTWLGCMAVASGAFFLYKHFCRKTCLHEKAEELADSNIAQAITIWQELAKEGDVQSMYRLGQVYEQLAISSNTTFDLALEWYRKALEHGLGLAQNDINRLTQPRKVEKIIPVSKPLSPVSKPIPKPISTEPMDIKAKLREIIEKRK